MRSHVPITPQSESVSEEDSDPEQAQRDKEMQKNLALLAKYFKKLYKPTNNNLQTSSNSKNKTEDTQHQGFITMDGSVKAVGNQRTMTVAGLGKQKPKRVKDYAYHKEKMMMCKQAEQGVPLQAEQADWLEDTDEEIDEQELEAHYSYMAKIQEVSPEESSSTGQPLEQVQNHDESNVYDNVRRHSEQPESINDTYVLEKDDSNVTPDSSNICTNDNQVDQNAAECVDERAALANLIANLTLDTEENKTILKQLKKANASLTQELEKCKTNLDETNSALGEAISCRDSCLIALQNKQNEFEKRLALKDIEIKEGLKTKAYEISVLNQKHDELVKKSLLTKSQLEGYLKENTKVISDLKVKEDKDIDKMIEMDKQLKFLNEIVYTRNQSIQTIHMLAPKCSTYNGRPTFANPRYLKKAQSDKPCLYEIPYDTSDPANRFAPDREGTMTLDNESRSKLNKDFVKPYDYTKQNSLYEIFKGPSLEYLYQLERGKEFAPILGYGDLIQGNVTIKRVYYVEGLNHNLFSVGQFCDADLEVAFRKSTCFVRDLQGNDLLTGSRGSDLYTISLQETTSSTPICFMAKASPTQAWLWHRRLSHLNFDYITLLSKKDVVTGLPKLTYVKDQLCSSCEMSKAKRSSFKSKVVPSSKGRLNLLHMDLCGPMRVASINGKKYIGTDN
ncbi:retrovirus-related pol polyprotein from transposon TNT 1-94 [Tanacetum coccineum]|uniref:Retrovirus-related pol polyprotein from transposon TNT 1-94 n=1 Tax=Tanacetum coccineum TaxID=301880 RepID=A0ABQ5E8B4_9ASTR